MTEAVRSIIVDIARCTGCVTCSKACPTKAIRVRDNLAQVKHELCIDCGECARVCPHEAARSVTTPPSDLGKFKVTVAIPSITLYAQFGKDVHPGQVLKALERIGFDRAYDLSWMCELVAGATDAFLAESRGPWPAISVTCPAITRMVQLRYPDLIPHLVPVESTRELAAKMLRRKLAAELSVEPHEIGLFFITPCVAIMHSILSPAGLEQSYFDGAISIAELYGPLLHAIKEAPEDDVRTHEISPQGLLWAMSGGEIAGLRASSTLTVRGVEDTQYVFDRIESGTLRNVDFIEAYICPDGCISGGLTVEGRYRAARTIQHLSRQLAGQRPVKEETLRSLLRQNFFHFEKEIEARPVRPLASSLREAIALRHQRDALLERLPGKNCAACGAPNCETFAEDILRGESVVGDCVFIRIEQLERELRERGEAPRPAAGAAGLTTLPTRDRRA
jgi:Fe-S-cluster-containing hydrogenase component 2